MTYVLTVLIDRVLIVFRHWTSEGTGCSETVDRLNAVELKLSTGY